MSLSLSCPVVEPTKGTLTGSPGQRDKLLESYVKYKTLNITISNATRLYNINKNGQKKKKNKTFLKCEDFI